MSRTHRPLAVHGAWTTEPPVHHDDRGFFVSTYVDTEHEALAGRPLFDVRQVSFSRSRAGVVRGIHVTRTPPGTEKYVYCSAGSVMDYVVDLRVGSPTFARASQRAVAAAWQGRSRRVARPRAARRVLAQVRDRAR